MGRALARASLYATLTLAVLAAPIRAADTDVKAARPAGAAPKAASDKVARGRYLLVVGSCNDCHTDKFGETGGNVPEKDWLLGGTEVGFRGPWGTTYATNLRLSLSRLTEEQWVKYAKDLKARPPMPWFNLNQWTGPDLRAFYQYVRQLGPAGGPAPDYVPPDKAPSRPVTAIQWPAPPAQAEGAAAKGDGRKK